MAKLEAAVFSVSVDNEAEIRDWLDGVTKARNAVETALHDLVDLCRTTPLIHMTIRRTTDEG